MCALYLQGAKNSNIVQNKIIEHSAEKYQNKIVDVILVCIKVESNNNIVQ